MNETYKLSEGMSAKDNLQALVQSRLGLSEAASAEPMIRRRGAAQGAQPQQSGSGVATIDDTNTDGNDEEVRVVSDEEGDLFSSIVDNDEPPKKAAKLGKKCAGRLSGADAPLVAKAGSQVSGSALYDSIMYCVSYQLVVEYS